MVKIMEKNYFAVIDFRLWLVLAGSMVTLVVLGILVGGLISGTVAGLCVDQFSLSDAPSGRHLLARDILLAGCSARRERAVSVQALKLVYEAAAALNPESQDLLFRWRKLLAPGTMDAGAPAE